MEAKELIKKIEEVKSLLPITTDGDDPNPRQLYFYKDGIYVESYDPVVDIKTDGHVVTIYNGIYTYEHGTEEFDTITIEPYINK